MIKRTRTLSLTLSMAVISLAASSLAAAPPRQADARTLPAAQEPDRSSGFGRLESITGTISMVRPEEGLLIVTQRGPGQPASTAITVAERVTKNPDGTTTKTDAGVQAVAPGPGETDYRFRVTSSTLIHVSGRSGTLNDLANMQNKQVTVHFVPQRNGNFAKGIEVSP
jgi:hypothetical protein